jgi:hypothetical protein
MNRPSRTTDRTFGLALMFALAACLLGSFGAAASASATQPEATAIVERPAAVVVAPVAALSAPRAAREVPPNFVWSVLTAAAVCTAAWIAFGIRDRRRPARAECRYPAPRLRGPPR